MSRTFRTTAPLEALPVEHALVLARQLQAAADAAPDAAPDGAVLARVEGLAVPAGREFTRTAVEAALRAQAAGAENKGAPGRTCATCHTPARPNRRATRNVLSAAGVVRLDRL